MPVSLGDVPPGTITVPLTPGFTIHSCCAFERNNIMEVRTADTPLLLDYTVTSLTPLTPTLLQLYTTAWKVESVMNGEVIGGLLGNWVCFTFAFLHSLLASNLRGY